MLGVAGMMVLLLDVVRGDGVVVVVVGARILQWEWLSGVVLLV